MAEIYQLFNAKVAAHAKKILLGGLCVLCVLAGPVTLAHAAPPAQVMYTESLAREQTVRAAIDAADAAPALLTDVHKVVAAYESLVRHYPTSGYRDNAPWQAGCLALDAYSRFGQMPDKDTRDR